MDKKVIRKIMKEKRLSLDKETLLSYNQSIIQQVISHSKYQESQLIGIYVSLSGEVSTHELIKQALKSKRVCVPKIEKGVMNFYEIQSFHELEEGYFHVLEPTNGSPIQPQEIDLMITPLLAYDKKLYRVGYGKGYYDRYFSQGCLAYRLGLAFSFQQVDMIVIDEYDYKLDEVLTE